MVIFNEIKDTCFKETRYLTKVIFIHTIELIDILQVVENKINLYTFKKKWN